MTSSFDDLRALPRSLILAPIFVVGCTEPTPSGGLPDPYDPDVTRVVMEVDVQEGAEPFTGPAVYGDTWALTEESLGALLAGEKALEVPSTLGEMGDAEDVPSGDLDVEDILGVSEASRDVENTDERAAYHVLFLDRFFESDGDRQTNVLGVSIGNTGVLAMFKPVIGEGGLVFAEGVDRFVEQATIVHEIGHAFGLVNNGLTMVRDHQDEEHGPHCQNDRCVMFYLNEGAVDAVQYSRDALQRGDRVLFDDDCLDDAAAALTSD